MQKEIIRKKYNEFAFKYRYGEELIYFIFGLNRLRKALLRNATGKVLEIAVGTGAGLPLYPKNCEITAIDLSPKMLQYAKKRTKRNITFKEMDAENLSFKENTFDSVVDTLSLCTFPNPIKALKEMARVCKPKGSLLLLEHGRSDKDWLARFQDRRAEKHAQPLGCNWNREPLELVKKGGLKILYYKRTFFGMFHIIKATK
ncbi:MAG: class I SAM-dependent methyltransferase [Candidatus Woesearchaeota archaeon]